MRFISVHFHFSVPNQLFEFLMAYHRLVAVMTQTINSQVHITLFFELASDWAFHLGIFSQAPSTRTDSTLLIIRLRLVNLLWGRALLAWKGCELDLRSRACLSWLTAWIARSWANVESLFNVKRCYCGLLRMLVYLCGELARGLLFCKWLDPLHGLE